MLYRGHVCVGPDGTPNTGVLPEGPRVDPDLESRSDLWRRWERPTVSTLGSPHRSQTRIIYKSLSVNDVSTTVSCYISGYRKEGLDRSTTTTTSLTPGVRLPGLVYVPYVPDSLLGVQCHRSPVTCAWTHITETSRNSGLEDPRVEVPAFRRLRGN